MDGIPSSDHVIVFMDDQNNKPHSLDQSHLTNNRSPEPTPHPPSALRRLSFSKPKSRFVEFSLPLNQNPLPEEDQVETYFPSDSDDISSSSDDDEGYRKERSGKTKKKKKVKMNWRIMGEWILLIMMSTTLVCFLTIPSLKKQLSCGLELWRWSLMILVTFSGRLVSGWIIRVVVFMVERNFMLREKVLYFVYGLRKSIQNCVWLALVLLSWTFIFNANLHRNNKLLRKLFQALVAVLIAATIWLLMIILVKVLASSFHVATYFDRMKESVFHHYVLDTLSGPPMDEAAYEDAHAGPRASSARVLSKRFGTRKIDIEKLRRLRMQTTASAWSVKRLVNYVRFFGLSTISKTVDDFGRTESEITREWEARSCAKRIFRNVAKPGENTCPRVYSLDFSLLLNKIIKFFFFIFF